MVAGEHAGQEGLALSRAAEGRHREGGQGVDGDAHRHAHPGARNLLDDLEVDLVGLAPAAELLRVRKRQQAGAAQGAEDVGGELLAQGGGGLGSIDLGAEFLGDDLTGEVEEVVALVGGEESLHRHAGTVGHRCVRRLDGRATTVPDTSSSWVGADLGRLDARPDLVPGGQVQLGE